jgi:peptidyl-prolyl cis-trans isomerase SurA
MAVLLALGVMTSAAAAEERVVDRIVAVVNEEVVLLSDLREARNLAVREAILMGDPDVEINDYEVLQRLIEDKLTRQEAERLNIGVTRREIDSAIADVLRMNRIDLRQLEELLAEDGVSIEEYRETIEEQIRRMKLTGMIVRDRVAVDRSRMQAYYSANRDEFIDTPKLNLRRVLFPPDALEIAREIHGRLQQEPFEAVQPVVEQHGGMAMDLGFMHADVLRGDYVAVAERLALDEWSEPFVTDEGVHLLHLRDRVPERRKTFDEVKDEIEERLTQEETERQFLHWLQELRARSHIRVML